MIDINLLNKKGIYHSNNINFNEIDEEITNNSMSTDESNIQENDFESDYESKSNSMKKYNKKKTILSIFVLITLLLVGFSFYYQFYIAYKSSISSKDLNHLVNYVLENDDITIERFLVDGNGIDIIFDIDYDSFDDYKAVLDEHFKEIDNDRQFEYIISKDKLYIKYPYYLNIVNDNFNQSLEVQDMEMDNYQDIDKEKLKEVLESMFSVNSEYLPDFTITSEDIKGIISFNVSFSK